MNGTRSFRRIAMAVVAVAAMAVLGTTLTRALTDGSGSAAGDSGTQQQAAGLMGRSAPPLSGPTVSGGTADLSHYRGRVVVVSIWASWCGPCRSELPVLARAHDHYRSSHVAFLGIATRDSRSGARAMLARTGLSGVPSILDTDGSIAIDWGATGVPETFVIDRSGRIRAHRVGAVTAGWLDKAVRPLVAP